MKCPKCKKGTLFILPEVENATKPGRSFACDKPECDYISEPGKPFIPQEENLSGFVVKKES